MPADPGKGKLPGVLKACGILMVLLGVIRILALAYQLFGLLSSQYLNSIMSHDGTQIILAFALDTGLTVLVGFAAYGLFRRRRWSFACTLIAALCSMLLLLPRPSPNRAWRLPRG